MGGSITMTYAKFHFQLTDGKFDFWDAGLRPSPLPPPPDKRFKRLDRVKARQTTLTFLESTRNRKIDFLNIYLTLFDNWKQIPWGWRVLSPSDRWFPKCQRWICVSVNSKPDHSPEPTPRGRGRGDGMLGTD